MPVIAAQLSRSNTFPGTVTATIWYDDNNGAVDRVEVDNQSQKTALVVGYRDGAEVYRGPQAPGLGTLLPATFGGGNLRWGKPGRRTNLAVSVSV